MSLDSTDSEVINFTISLLSKIEKHSVLVVLGYWKYIVPFLAFKFSLQRKFVINVLKPKQECVIACLAFKGLIYFQTRQLLIFNFVQQVAILFSVENLTLATRILACK